MDGDKGVFEEAEVEDAIYTIAMKYATNAHRTYLAACHMLCQCMVLATGVAFGQITLNGEFDHGSLDEANSSVNGSMVTLAGRDNFNPGDWKWLYFSADNVNSLQPTFQIDDDFATGGSNLNDHEMVYSYDQQNWQFHHAKNLAGGDDRVVHISGSEPHIVF